MNTNMKNVKISEKHHEMIKNHCNEKGLKIHKLIERLIEENCKPKKKDIYNE